MVPLHWIIGVITKGFEDHPVIYVNREDVDPYVRWLSKKEGRVYAGKKGAPPDWAGILTDSIQHILWLHLLGLIFFLCTCCQYGLIKTIYPK